MVEVPVLGDPALGLPLIRVGPCLNGEAMGELALVDVVPVGVVFMNTRVPVAVGNEQVTRFWLNRNVCWAVERITILPCRRLTFFTQAE